MPDRLYHPDVESMPRTELNALQLERLRRQLERCYASSPFYREKFDEAGVGPDDLRSLADLARFPVVTKEELRDEQAAHPPFGGFVVAPEEDWAETHPSSGTTGRPANTIWSHGDVRAEHVWVDPDSREVLALTGFEHACFLPREADIAFLLWIDGIGRDDALTRAFYKGYGAARTMDVQRRERFYRRLVAFQALFGMKGEVALDEAELVGLTRPIG